MTTDLIYGSSILPKNFRDGLQYWRSQLNDIHSTRIDDLSGFRVIQTMGDDYGKLKVISSKNTHQIIHHNLTPIKIGQYLEIKAKVRLASGAAPSARIIATPVASNGTIISGASTNGPSSELELGITHEISAIVGSGNRPGVDMAWGQSFTDCYCGIEIFGPTGGEIIIDDLQVLDATGHFLSTNSDWVDIRDFGAIGNGKHDCLTAFQNADREADGRSIYIPDGRFFISDDLTLLSPIRAQGRIICNELTAVMLAADYDLESYVQVFKDVSLAFRKALQALFRFKNHNSLDLCGKNVTLYEPIDVYKLVNAVESFTTPRIIHNGQIMAGASSAWSNKIVKAQANNSSSDPKKLTNVQNIAQIEVGSLVQGKGVGREIYVKEKNEAQKTLTLTRALCNPASTQNYQFTRFQFMLDFSGFARMSRLEFTNIDFRCDGNASIWLMAKEGFGCKFSHNYVREPKDRGICSAGEGCFALTVESCFFVSREDTISAKDRSTIAISTRENDIKIRNNNAAYFRHFAFLDGCGHIVLGNHWYQGNKNGTTDRSAGVVITYTDAKTLFVGNYVDNSWIEITNEQSRWLENRIGTHFGELTITGNIFTANSVDNSFRWIKLAPHGHGLYIDGITVTSNAFYMTSDNTTDRVEEVDNSEGSIDFNKTRNLVFADNSFKGIKTETYSPITRTISRSSAASIWSEEFGPNLPFGSKLLRVESVVALSNLSRQEWPLCTPKYGSSGTKLALKFSSATRGSVSVKVASDLTH